ncbi:tetratricopeptide repeat protein [Flavobacteriaceae bacterium TP-CH-4]|uniref:Oxygen sensor histidine kinase NreB n=1 Tax=Pelagihabitans pacificus TaxID=2696054 RepID=A0A967AUB6_9FLAO|nr:sensor histidine kinase [Pelagihabitans pacificus]NHF59158.1 tetratricopeptide repeat protein [Pelagihabitans pacificus]
MKRFLSFLFLLVVPLSNVHAQNDHRLDSLKLVLTNTHKDSLIQKIDNYGEVIWAYATTRTKLDSARLYTDSLIQFSRNAGVGVGVAKSNFYYGVISRFEGNYDQGLEFLEKSAAYSKANPDSLDVTSSLFQTAVIHQKLGNFAESLSIFYEILEIHKSRGNILSAAEVLNSIGHILRKVGKQEEAIKNYKEAVEIFEKIAGREISLSMTYESLGNTFAELKQFDSAKDYLLKSLAIEKKENNIDGIASVTENLGHLAYVEEDYEEALRYQMEALEIRKDMPSKNNIAISLNKVGTTYIKLGKAQMAKKYLLESLDISNQIGSKPLRQMNYEGLIEVNEKNGTFKEGFEYQKSLMDLKDSLLDIGMNKQILELEKKYETANKERIIAEQQLVIEQKELQKNQILLAIGTLALLLLGTVIFFTKRIKYQRTIAIQAQALQKQKIIELQQRNKLLALNSMIEGQEAERLRIANDLHDSLGGLLSTVKNHFATIQKEIQKIEELDLTQKTNTLIDEACMEVRRISHNMVPHALSISGLQGAIEDLAEQLNGEGYGTTVEFAGKFDTLEDSKKVMIFRLVQEIISNIRKHAEAKNILIQILDHQKELKLIVEDDGQGFLYEEALTKGGLGLKSINSRVEFLDGDIDWDSELGKGTTISISIPL